MLRLALLVLVLASCGGSLREEQGSTEYSVSAQKNYDHGMEKLEDEDYIEATKLFTFVKARFPYSKFAVLAELRLADTLFASGAYLEAIDAYKQFIKFHPTHEMVENGYAPFRVGESYYKTLPDDWFLMPPAFERDPSSVVDALRELAGFVRRYPTSKYAKDAEKMRQECARTLAAHEWYVATFYWDRDKPEGTVLRLKTLLEKYPGVGYDAEALFLLGKAYVRAGKAAEAKQAWHTLLAQHPNSKRAAEAKSELAKLGG